MSDLSVAGVYIVILAILIGSLVTFLLGFKAIFDIRWYMDYFKMMNDICTSSKAPKMEIESFRYNFYIFLKKENTFSRLMESFKQYFYSSLSMCTLLVIVLLTITVTNNILLSYDVYVLMFSIYIIYTAVGNVIIAQYNDIKKKLESKENQINVYSEVFVILNAIVLINDMDKLDVEYSTKELNKPDVKLTIGDVIKNNISARENIHSSSKIIQMITESVQNLDILKYLVYDTLSPYYLTFFENVYVTIPDGKYYLMDVYNKKNISVDYAKIKLIFKDIAEDIGNDQHRAYVAIKDLITKDYPIDVFNSNTQFDNLSIFLKKITDTYGDVSLENYDKILYDNVGEKIDKINVLMANNKYNKVYQYINNKIGEIIKSKSEKDYIKYFIENKDVLLNNNVSFNDIVDTVDYITYLFYAIILVFAIFVLIMLHILYIHINDYKYGIILVSIIVIYLFTSYFYLMSKNM